MRRSASLVTSPAFKQGSTYTIKTKGYEKNLLPQRGIHHGEVRRYI